MTRIIVKELVFDEYNRQHIKKHSVTETEIIEAGKNLIYHRQSYEGKYLAIGRSGTRIITIVIRNIGRGKYYVVTARDASKKERRKVYAKEKK